MEILSIERMTTIFDNGTLPRSDDYYRAKDNEKPDPAPTGAGKHHPKMYAKIANTVYILR